jgi:hypothetical protein
LIHVDGQRLVDARGRTCILRGVNLGGSSKIPSRGAPGDHRGVSFVGRPFPPAEAEEHFRRLRDWGMLFNRVLVTWEAVEHRGPGEYDRGYLDCLEAVLARGAALGLRFVIDFHQDVWSRFTGGDGAPGWTLELAGLNPRSLAACGAAVLDGGPNGRPVNLLWPTNTWKLGAATMATLFFAGDAFAPGERAGRESMQSFLQDRYAGFAREVARKLAHIDAVVGFDLMNEPPVGWVGYPDLASDRYQFVRVDATPSPFDGMAAGSGFAREVPVYRQTLLGLRTVGKCTLNPGGASAWLPGRSCPWLRHGVWTERAGRPVLLRPDHFVAIGGRPVSFGADFLRPFLSQIGREIHDARPDALLFIEDAPRRRELRWSEADGPNAVHAGHWYDGLVMYRKRFSPRLGVDGETMRPSLGKAGVRRSFRRQIGRIARIAVDDLGGIPPFVGEYGLPFDLDRGAAFRTGDFAEQSAGLAAYADALDDNLLGGTVWNYTADNGHERGDGWNGEDFSVYSRDDGGGRAVAGFCRPYATRIPGAPIRMRYEPGRCRFALAWRGDPGATGEAEIFVPPALALRGLSVRVSDGAWRFDAAASVLVHEPGADRAVHEVAISWPPPSAPRRPVARSSR